MTLSKDIEAILRRSYFILLICIAVTMPFNIPNVNANGFFIILLLVNSIPFFFLSKNKKERSFKWIVILFISVYAIHVFGLLYCDNLREGSFELQKKLSLLLFPLIFYFSPVLTGKELKIVLLSFVISCLITGLFCLSVAIHHFFAWRDESFFFYHSLSAIAGMHSSYFSMYFCFSIGLLLCIYLKEVTEFTSQNKILYYTSVLIFIFLLLLLGSRIQLLILIAGLISFFFIYFYKKLGLLKTIFVVAGAVAVLVGFIFLIPANRERFKEAVNYRNQYAMDGRWSDEQVRYLIWSSARELIQTRPLTGAGTGDVQDELQKYYIDHECTSLTYLPDTRYNAHNQFLETAIGLGIPGVLLLLASFLIPLLYGWRNKQSIYVIFIMLFMISCMTESMLERQNGVVFYAFFNSLLFFNSVRKTEKNISDLSGT